MIQILPKNKIRLSRKRREELFEKSIGIKLKSSKPAILIGVDLYRRPQRLYHQKGQTAQSQAIVRRRMWRWKRSRKPCG